MKSGKAECPICRAYLSIKIDNDVLDSLENPEQVVLFSVILYQLYSLLISSDNRIIGLDHFINTIISNIIPLNHPRYNSISSILYGEALHLFFSS